MMCMETEKARELKVVFNHNRSTGPPKPACRAAPSAQPGLTLQGSSNTGNPVFGKPS